MISSSTLGKISESMMWPWRMTSSTNWGTGAEWAVDWVMTLLLAWRAGAARVARSRMDQEEARVGDRHGARNRQRPEKAAVVAGQAFQGQGPRDAGEVLEAVLAADVDVLGGPVVVVAADRVRGVFAHPVDAG